MNSCLPSHTSLGAEQPDKSFLALFVFSKPVNVCASTSMSKNYMNTHSRHGGKAKRALA